MQRKDEVAQLRSSSVVYELLHCISGLLEMEQDEEVALLLGPNIKIAHNLLNEFDYASLRKQRILKELGY